MRRTLLRTEACYQRYLAREISPGCVFCANRKRIKTYTHWFITENRFPYDAFARVSHLLVPIDHVAKEKDLTEEALSELKTILTTIDDEGTYDSVMANFTNIKTQPQHLHYHLLTLIYTEGE